MFVRNSNYTYIIFKTLNDKNALLGNTVKIIFNNYKNIR